MNKYEVTLHTFCDACVNGNTCKGTCKRMQIMEKLVNKYDKLNEAYDKSCAELSIGTNWFSNKTKDEVKEHFLNGD